MVIVVIVVEGFAEKVLLVAGKDMHRSNDSSEGDLRGSVIGAGLPRRRGIRHRAWDFDARGLL
jgi:hypothetical protein